MEAWIVIKAAKKAVRTGELEAGTDKEIVETEAGLEVREKKARVWIEDIGAGVEIKRKEKVCIKDGIPVVGIEAGTEDGIVERGAGKKDGIIEIKARIGDGIVEIEAGTEGMEVPGEEKEVDTEVGMGKREI